MLRTEVEAALADLHRSRRPAPPSPLVWRPMSSLPVRLKDGRDLLFWEKTGPVVGRWHERSVCGIDRSFWSTGFAGLPDGDLIAVTDPLYWAEIAEPRLWPSAAG
jgi:hypothetical protein